MPSACMPGSRQPFVHPDDRVVPLIMDVTDWAQIQRGVESVESLDVLINNAGVSLPDDLNSRAAFEQHFDVNVYGPVMVTQALMPSLTESTGTDRQRRLDRCLRRCARPSGLFGLEGSSVLGDAVAARAPGRPGREGSCRPARPDRHRHGPRPHRSRSPRRSRSPKPSSTAWRTGMRRSSPTRSRRSQAESWREGAAKELERQNAALVPAEPIAA